MGSRNNTTMTMERFSDQQPEYGLRKLSVGVASVLLGTTVGLGVATNAHAATVNAPAPAPQPAAAATPAQATTPAPAAPVAPARTAPVAHLMSAQAPAPVRTAPVATPAPAAPAPVRPAAPVQPAAVTPTAPAKVTAPATNSAPQATATPRVTAPAPAATPQANNPQQKEDQWNVSVGYKYAAKDYSAKVPDANAPQDPAKAHEVTIFAVPDKANQKAADATNINIQVTDRNPGSHNELTVTPSGNLGGGQPVVKFKNAFNGTIDYGATPTDDQIKKGNVKGHYYTVYDVRVPLDTTSFGWQYQQPTEFYTAEITLDHINNGVTIDQSKDITDSVDVYQYGDQIMYHYHSDDGKIDQTVKGPLILSSHAGPTMFDYNVPDGYVLANTDQVKSAGFEEDPQNPGNPLEAHYGTQGWPEVSTSPNETTVDVPLKLAAVKSGWSGQFVDQDENNQTVGDPVVVNGNSGQTLPVVMTIPENYELAPKATLPTQATLTDTVQNVTVPLVHKHLHFTDANNPDPAKYTTHQTLTRTINVHTPAEKLDVKKQATTLTRTGDLDLVTNRVAYTPWTTGSWDAFTAPAFKGYAPMPAQVAAQPVHDGDKDTTVDITYQALMGTWQGQFVDTDENNAPVGQPDVLTGSQGTNGTPQMTVPDGYELAPGQQVPGSVTFTDTPQTVTIGLRHKTHTVKPGDADAKNFDLVHDATRTITLTGLEKVANAPKGTTQKAEVTRMAVVDDVTKQARSYTPWSTAKWDAYQAPAVAGYKATPALVAAVTVTNETKDTTATVAYQSIRGSWTGQFVDGDGNNTPVGQPVTVSGDEGTSQLIKMAIPDNYELAPGQTLPTSAVMTNGDVKQTITLKHKHELVNAGDPDAKKFKLDLKKAVTRTIEFKGLNDKLDPVVQKVVLLRSGDVDLVTKQVVYTAWSTDQWPDFKVPTQDGFTPDKTDVPMMAVNGDTKDALVVVTFTANAPASEAPSAAPSEAAPAAEPAAPTPMVAAPAAPAPAVMDEPAAGPAPAAMVAAPEAVMAAPEAPAAAVLPQTGNQSTSLAVLGLALASLTLGGVLLKKQA